MKIRIKDNSIRLRLTKTDVDDLRNKHVVACRTVISEKELFQYELRILKDATKISAAFGNGKITLTLSPEIARVLTETNEITVKGEQNNGVNEKLSLLIEKDLQCLDETEEDQSDMYDNPNSAC